MVMVGMIFVVVATGGERLKNTTDAFECDTFAGKKLKHGRIFRHAHCPLQHLHAKMQIAEAPRHSRGLFQGGDRNFQHFFRRLLDNIGGFTQGEKMGSMIYRLLEIKAKFPAVFRDAAPTPLRERGAINAQKHMGMMSVNSMRVRTIMDDRQF